MIKRKLKKAWVWPFTEEELYRGLCVGKTLHVCCGESKLGDVRVNKYVDSADYNYDLMQLPFEDNSFDTIICDPPWEYYLKPWWIQKFAKIARQRIILISPCNVMPRITGFESIPFIVCTSWGSIYVKLCVVYDRVNKNVKA